VQTRIPAYYVRMIESDSYDAIPDQLYLLPFFRRYAIFLGLDEQKVVARFIRDFEKSENEIVETKAPRSKGSNRKPPNLKLWRQVATAVVIVGLLLTFLARGIAMIRSTLNHPADSSSPVVVSSNALPPSTVLPQDSPRLVNKAPQPVDDTPNVSTDTQRPLNDAPHPLNDPPHVLNDAPPPVAPCNPPRLHLTLRRHQRSPRQATHLRQNIIADTCMMPRLRRCRAPSGDRYLISSERCPAS